MSKEHLKREPHNISEHVWWYEEPRGISVLIEPTVNGERCKDVPVVEAVISWRAIRAALKRLDT